MFRLALALGKTVGELEETLTPTEFLEWQIFNVSWPIGERRLDLNFAQLCAVIAQVNGNRNARPIDFMLATDQPLQENPEEISDEDLAATFGTNVRRIKR